MVLKPFVFALFFFLSTGLCPLNTAAKAQRYALIQSHQKPQGSAIADSNKHRVKAQPYSKMGSSFKFAFFEKRAEGWHWYENPPSDDKVEEETPKRGSTSSSPTPTAKIEAQRKALEQKLHAAIVEPTRENLIAYIIAQKALMDQSQKFSESWQRVVMTTPALDETLIHPVDQNALHVYYEEKNKELTKRIKGLSQSYGLFFFFKGNCPYCHQFAPVVKHFAAKHGWSVLAVSLDGGTLPDFPHARRNNGIAERFQVAHVPALIALHSGSGQTIPLAYGLVAESEIERRVELLTRTFHSEGVSK
ncbi:MAG: type-F conjugative transfer system pilin assembly protein TraF [Alphaproteobacteria bacterium]|nr:type-F conjugative transfer system pilin assembly protein TraF [Alphaproteobacteria bacterium]